MKVRYCAFTKKGQYHECNEDRVMVGDRILRENSEEEEKKSPFLAVVCDGVGGEKHGEEAAELSASAFIDFPYSDASMFHIEKILCQTNERILRFGIEHPDYAGMASSIAGVVLEKDRYIVFNVGDTRVYRVTDGKTVCISEDHTLAAQRRYGAYSGTVHDECSHVLTRYIGGYGNACRPHIGINRLKPEMAFLICSDGVYREITEPDLKKITGGEEALPVKSRKLIDKLYKTGGEDDQSFVLIEYSE